MLTLTVGHFMTDQPTFNRRRVLELSGVGTTLAVAGCTSLDSSGLGDDERRATVVIEPDQEALQQRRIEIAQEGELNQQEAEAELQELQIQLLEEAYENVQAEFEDLDLSIEDTLQDQALLVSGPATALIDGLDVEGVGSLIASSVFEQAREQQEAQEAQEDQQQPPVEEEPPAEDEEGSEDSEDSEADSEEDQ